MTKQTPSFFSSSLNLPSLFSLWSRLCLAFCLALYPPLAHTLTRTHSRTFSLNVTLFGSQQSHSISQNLHEDPVGGSTTVGENISYLVAIPNKSGWNASSFKYFWSNPNVDSLSKILFSLSRFAKLYRSSELFNFERRISIEKKDN